MNKAAEAFRTIGEVADELTIPKHVLRFWEGKFPQIRPMKRGGGRRYYRPEDMELLRGIRTLLHAEGYTIRGVQKILREHGIDQVKAAARRGLAAASQAEGQESKKKRGRKRLTAGGIADAVTAIAEETAPPPAPMPEPTPVRVDAKARIATALRELEIARAILSGKSVVEATAAEGSRGQAQNP
jgi:DNA-binding transcriptional MerR regulator